MSGKRPQRVIIRPLQETENATVGRWEFVNLKWSCENWRKKTKANDEENASAARTFRSTFLQQFMGQSGMDIFVSCLQKHSEKFTFVRN